MPDEKDKSSSILDFLRGSYKVLCFPNVLFRRGAVFAGADLARRQPGDTVDEFVAWAIPCILLHLATAAVLWLGGHFGFGRPVPDFDLLARLFGEPEACIRLLLVDSARRAALLQYIVALCIVSWLNGSLYGVALRRITLRPRTTGRLPLESATPSRATRVLSVVRSVGAVMTELVYATAFKLWNSFFGDDVVPLFAWALQRPFLQVRMRTGETYVGQFDGYTKDQRDMTDRIALSQTYCYTPDTD